MKNYPKIVNRTIFTDDNLSTMRGMDDDSIDLIYLDPPFNKNKIFAAPISGEKTIASFKDQWTLDDLKNQEHGELARRHQALHDVIGSAELSHSKGMKAYLLVMSIRLLEMQRILKNTGSIYLHCDSTAGHYLKIVMDSIFGRNNFVNEIVWNSATGPKNNASKKYGRAHDTILYYTMPDCNTFNTQYNACKDGYIDRAYKYVDDNGERYRVDNLTIPFREGGSYEFLGVTRNWRHNPEKMNRLLEQGRIAHKSIGEKHPGINVPSKIFYLKDSKGSPVQDNWTDIGGLTKSHAEWNGYPTQKPLALLERIIKTSSNEGDRILDPFCGCATTCVVAEKLNRQWIGIDISDVAVGLVRQRLASENCVKKVVHRTDQPEPSYEVHDMVAIKDALYSEQNALCLGCNQYFPYKNLTLDHKHPRSQGANNRKDNMALLCGFCNSRKGDRLRISELIVLNKKEGMYR